ncbi:MAG TPA: GNAT family N-acetyltransferase [Pyrinomonadaceae bacterium]|nr:GNAT family N-acetyltransferase [Pyrinomonadaceae bacterium]
MNKTNVETILETERLRLRKITVADAEFIHRLMNEPAYLEYIGDKGVKTVADAERFITDFAAKSYDVNGFGHYIVELKTDGTPMGTCGYVKRAELEDPDIGFAFLPDFRKHGYALESAEAIKSYGIEVLGFTKISAITTQHNERSGKLLNKLGFTFDRLIAMPKGDELKLFTFST